jgi:hypothetical protein
MIVLVVLSFLSIWIIIGNTGREPNWRLALIQALIILGGFLILATEVLNLFNAINRLWLGIIWSLPILSGVIWTWLRLRRGKVLRLPIIYHRDSWLGTVLDLFVILIMVITAVVAFVSPPNSNSALVSDMSRIAHWAQNQSLAHYATGIESQNSHSPGAEIMMLNFYILGDGDGLVNLVSWICFAGSVAAAASLAEVMGAKVNGQRLAAIFTATLPAAITLATGSTNDIVVTFWVISTVLMVLYYTRKEQKPIILVLAAISAALAIATKASAFIFLWPFALYILIILRRRIGMAKTLLWALIAFVIMAAFNTGHYYRNQQTYGQFYRPVELTEQMNEMRNWRVLVSNITRNASLHADLPFPRADRWLKANLITLHEKLGLDISDERTTIGGSFYIPEVNTSEMTSGNPVHAAMIAFSFTAVVGMVLLGKEDPEILVYSGGIFFSMLLFCYLLKWQPSGGRLQLPFFFLFAPLISVLLDKLERFELEIILALILVAYAMPWVFQTYERPIIPSDNRTSQYSVFNENRDKLYFVTVDENYKAYRWVTNEIKNLGITKIGLDLTSESEEYPYWALLDSPNDDLRIEWIATETASAGLLDEDFIPEVIIAEGLSADEIDRYSQDYDQQNYFGIDLFIRKDG